VLQVVHLPLHGIHFLLPLIGVRLHAVDLSSHPLIQLPQALHIELHSINLHLVKLLLQVSKILLLDCSDICQPFVEQAG
jgi:hypothetical protein